MKEPKYAIIISVAIFAILCAGYYFLFASPGGDQNTEQFVIPLQNSDVQTIKSLSDAGFIRSSFGFALAHFFRGNRPIKPGGYRLSKTMNAFSVLSTLNAPPYLEWIIVQEGVRKEQIAAVLAQTLGWNQMETDGFLNAYRTLGQDYREGVYFPDTYLFPIDGTGSEIAARFIAHFNERFTSSSAEAAAQNIKWTTVLKIASLIEREAAGKNDMPLIAGIIWNRLGRGMPLAIDATIQYARGDVGKGFWAPLVKGDTAIISPYNTYLHKGLPPTPICDPGLNAIESALNPMKTACLYYLHDSTGTIHCAATYAEHKANIEKYLK